ncbi:hypothetical protein SADUNF_Sadunf17G0090500 [Salix dunnii]|uniref:BHLH domain-containing protein n=1 Tax=Salix dunnii TaxID=1413687 RepID=A0A835J8P0_9ROSI|nr:hypothetical protein SADUNF_Sadunf17G0090500 [Salix dunnii]
MSSRPAKSKISLKKTERRRRPHSGACKAQRSVCNGGLTSSSKVSDKLETLKNLIPATGHNGETVKPDQLFKETADYILLLKTQELGAGILTANNSGCMYKVWERDAWPQSFITFELRRMGTAF